MINERLKEVRNQFKKTQEVVAMALKLPTSTYRGYELGTSKTPCEILIKLANFYDVSLDYLCGRTWENKVGHIPENRSDVVQAIIALSDEKFEQVKSFVQFVGNKD